MAAMAQEYLESGWVVRMPRYCQKRSRLHHRGGGGGGREGIKDRTTLRLRLDRGKLEAGKGVNTVLFPVCGGTTCFSTCLYLSSRWQSALKSPASVKTTLCKWGRWWRRSERWRRSHPARHRRRLRSSSSPKRLGDDLVVIVQCSLLGVHWIEEDLPALVSLQMPQICTPRFISIVAGAGFPFFPDAGYPFCLSLW